MRKKLNIGDTVSYRDIAFQEYKEVGRSQPITYPVLYTTYGGVHRNVTEVDVEVGDTQDVWDVLDHVLHKRQEFRYDLHMFTKAHIWDAPF